MNVLANDGISKEGVEKLRGLVGTSVKISIARAGEDEVLIKSSIN